MLLSECQPHGMAAILFFLPYFIPSRDFVAMERGLGEKCLLSLGKYFGKNEARLKLIGMPFSTFPELFLWKTSLVFLNFCLCVTSAFCSHACLWRGENRIWARSRHRARVPYGFLVLTDKAGMGAGSLLLTSFPTPAFCDPRRWWRTLPTRIGRMVKLQWLFENHYYLRLWPGLRVEVRRSYSGIFTNRTNFPSSSCSQNILSKCTTKKYWELSD